MDIGGSVIMNHSCGVSFTFILITLCIYPCAHDPTLWPVIVYAFSQFNPTSGPWLSITFGCPSLHAPFIPSLFLVTMQSTQETKNSISSSVYGIQQLFRDFEKQCHILTTPATEGTLTTLYHHHHFNL